MSPRWQRKGQMAHALKTIGVIGICLGLFLLFACSTPAPTSTPTLDLDPFRTEVAATVLAQVTQDLAMTPSATPVPSPTGTLAPTSTAASTLVQTTTATLIGGTPGTATSDQAEWISQTIADGTIFAPGEAFIVTWHLRNAGTSTWTVSYMLRFYSGDDFGAPPEILLGQVVAPGEEVDISLAMTAPTTPGDYRSDWVMANESLSNFNEPFYLEIAVAIPATPTPTATMTPTTTATPSATATP
jgi:Ig-like domain from next to BRCA1 gene